MKHGSESAVIMLANGAVLKTTRINQLKLDEANDWGTAPNDARLLHPLVFIGERPRDEWTPDVQREHFATYFQEYVKAPVTIPQAEQLMTQMRALGCQLSDCL